MNAINIRLLHAIGAVDVVQRDAVVEFGFLLVSEVAKAVPLTGRLGVEGPDVVVDDAGRFLVDFFVELLAAEEGEVGLGVEWPVEVDAHAGCNFCGGGFDDVVCQAVQGA